MKEKLQTELYDYQAAVDGPTVLILAGVHGDEYEPMLAMARLRQLLESKLQKGRVKLMPVVNKSAFQQGQRCGEDGLDLARVCPGDLDGSPTLRYAALVSEQIASADYLIDLHTGGQLFDLYPLSGYMIHPDVAILEKQRRMAKCFGLPLIWGTDPYLDGRTLSVARDHQVPAIYVEYGGPGPIRSEVVEAYLQGCMQILQDLEMIEGAALLLKEPDYWVEDDDPGAGYLQGKMQSSVEGIFEGRVQVGDQVKKGDLWGIVYASTDFEPQEVFADTDGLVLFTRAVPKVKAADSLGGILPLKR